MTAVIINFQKAVALRNHRLSVVENVVKQKAMNECADSDSYSSSISFLKYSFFEDNVAFIKNMRSIHPRYKYPSILAEYRRGINPIAAVYNEFQKVLFTEDTSLYGKWVMELMANKEWVASIVNAVRLDAIQIDLLLNKYKCFDDCSNYKMLSRLKKDFANYDKAFSDFI